MKKISLLFAIFITIGAGCAATTPPQVQGKAADEQPAVTQQKPMKRTRDGQEDLAQQYGKAILHTTKGDISVQFYADESPVTVNNFMHLAQEGFYDGTAFHRVIKDFMIQGGDPLSRDKESGQLPGSGGPGYAFEDEFNNHRLVRGSLAMANAGPNTNGSQFFIVTAAETPWLDRRHTNFGEVIAGMNVVDSIENTAVDSNDNPTDPIVITSVELQ